VPLYLTEKDVDGLIESVEAVDAVEECFQRLARGAIENMPRRRLGLEGGALAVMAAADSELGLAGSKTYLATAEGTTFVVTLPAEPMGVRLRPQTASEPEVVG